MKKDRSLIATLALCSALLASACSREDNDPSNTNPLDRPVLRTLVTMEAASSSTSTLVYTPAQIRHAYGFDQLTANGAGQKIAIIDAYGSPTIQNDLDVFSAQWGLPKATVAIYQPEGQPKTNGPWASETSLDVEWAHAIAPEAQIMLVEAKQDTTADLLSAVSYAVLLGADQISMSWGASEFSSEVNYDYIFNQPGVSFVASSGDDGTGVIWPSTSPYVLAVGGTTLYLNAAGTPTSPETAWNGSGGGQSAYELQPAYQKAFQTSIHRSVPDVSYLADPSTGFYMYDSTPYSNSKGAYTGWFVVGGTSAGAPQWAALLALANAERKKSLQQSSSDLYSVAGASTRANYYNDITSGCNSSSDIPDVTCAGVGYDEVTGIGSPKAAGLVPYLGQATK